MNDIFNRLINIFDNYYLANYLIGGCALCLGFKLLGIYELDENWYTTIIIYYFAGMISSRISSILVEPILEKSKFINKATYSGFMKAEKKDGSGKLLELSKVNSIYRTMCGTFLILFICETYTHWPFPWIEITNLSGIAASLGLFVLFMLSYRKQTAYIKKRVNFINGNETSN